MYISSHLLDCKLMTAFAFVDGLTCTEHAWLCLPPWLNVSLSSTLPFTCLCLGSLILLVQVLEKPAFQQAMIEKLVWIRWETKIMWLHCCCWFRCLQVKRDILKSLIDPSLLSLLNQPRYTCDEVASLYPLLWNYRWWLTKFKSQCAAQQRSWIAMHYYNQTSNRSAYLIYTRKRTNTRFDQRKAPITLQQQAVIVYS